MNLWHSASPVIPNIQMRKLRLSDLAKVVQQINNHCSPSPVHSMCLCCQQRGSVLPTTVLALAMDTQTLKCWIMWKKRGPSSFRELGWGSSHGVLHPPCTHSSPSGDIPRFLLLPGRSWPSHSWHKPHILKPGGWDRSTFGVC